MTINEKTNISLSAAAVVLSVAVVVALWMSTGTQEAKADARAALSHNVIQDQRIDKIESAIQSQKDYLIQILNAVKEKNK